MLKQRAISDRRGVNALKSIISAYLAVILSLGAALPLLHVAFSSHHHRYCSLHGQIEHFDRKENAPASVSNESLDRTGRDGIAVRKSSESEPRRHVACALLNNGLLRYRLTHDDSGSVAIERDDGNVTSDVSESTVPRCHLFLLAPKHSPPVSVRKVG